MSRCRSLRITRMWKELSIPSTWWRWAASGAYDLGYPVPERLGLVGVDNSIYGEICIPKLTTLDNRLEALSESAASILREGLEGKIQSKKMMLFSEVIEREST